MPDADRTPRAPDVVCISSIDWDFIWQGHQEIMSTLAAEGQRVLFVENTGVRAPSVRDLPRLRQRIRNWWKSTKGFREERPNLFVYSPLVLPLPYSRLARWVNRVLMMRALRRWMRATGLYRPDRLDVSADAAGPRSHSRPRPAADRLLLHRRSAASSPGGEAHRAKRAAVVPGRRSRVRDVGEAAAARGAASAGTCICFRSASASSGSSACCTAMSLRPPICSR